MGRGGEGTCSTDQWVERLSCLLDGLVECFRGGVAALAKNLVLCQEHTMDSAHEAAALAVEVLYRVSIGWLVRVKSCFVLFLRGEMLTL